jgi:hypothetical protein
MLLWILLILGWAVVLFLAVSLFRLAGYADRKMRGSGSSAAHPRVRREDQAA